MKNAAVTATIAVLLIASSARSAEPPQWSAGARAGILWIGHDRPTGGPSLGAHGRHSWIGEQVAWHVGVGLDVVGLGGPVDWLAVLGGPEVGAEVRIGERWSVGLAAVCPYGVMGVCSDPGICLHYWGIYPGGSAAVWYRFDQGAVGAELLGLYVDTLASRSWDAWDRIAKGARLTGTISW